MKPKKQKRDEAMARQADYDAMSLDAKIALATKRGGKKELAKLLAKKGK